MAFLGSVTNPASLVNLGNLPIQVPWWMFDLDNQQLISLSTAPRSVSVTQDIKYTNIAVPGLDGEPSSFSGLGNPRISFSIQAIARNDIIGNQILTQQFEALRRSAVGLLSVFSEKEKFKPNPRVLIQYGTGSLVPLVYKVMKCDMVHSEWNALGYPKVTDISVELQMDFFHPINKAEAAARKALTLLGTLQSAGTIVGSLAGGRSNYL